MKMRRALIAGLVLIMAGGMLVPFLCCSPSATTLSVRADDRCPLHGTGKRAGVVPLTVAGYITAAYWFTSSTSFANPAVTIARGLTDTFSGIEPAGIPGFIAAQLLGAACGDAPLPLDR
jgi:glycerol uptake facilitator-like aquaporin